MSRKKKTKFSATDTDGRELTTRASADLPVKRFFETIDNEKLQLFLEEHDKYAPFLAALRSPEYAVWSYARIMREFNVTLHEINSLYRDGQRNIGLFSMSSHLPKIMEDVSVDAESRMVVCPRCDGERMVKTSDEKTLKVCPECDGAGKTRQVGDKHARDLVFESVGLTAQKGPLLAIQQNFTGNGGAGLNSSMEDTLRLTQTVTMGDRSGVEE